MWACLADCGDRRLPTIRLGALPAIAAANGDLLMNRLTSRTWSKRMAT
jgi:hypothetical protein